MGKKKVAGARKNASASVPLSGVHGCTYSGCRELGTDRKYTLGAGHGSVPAKESPDSAQDESGKKTVKLRTVPFRKL